MRLLLTGVGVALKPWRPVLPRRREGKSITIGHFDLRQTLRVDDLVLLDNLVFEEQEGNQSVNLIGA